MSSSWFKNGGVLLDQQVYEEDKVKFKSNKIRIKTILKSELFKFSIIGI
jgi:hypothetical protein